MGQSFKDFDHFQCSFPAPAKVNLRLKIEGRTPKDYHLLSMLNASIGFSDQISLRFNTSKRLGLSVQTGGDCNVEPQLLENDRNLALRALKGFFERFDIPLGAELSLEKCIPLGSGLGGGSGNAAAVLLNLKKLFFPLLTGLQNVSSESCEEQLADLALGLGADIPFLLRGGIASVRGIGEKIDPLDCSFVQNLKCILVLPPLAISTAEVFKQARSEMPLSAFSSDAKLRDFVALIKNKTTAADASLQVQDNQLIYKKLLELVENDLLKLVCLKFPLINNLWARLSSSENAVCGLSGSGSAFFALPNKLNKLDNSFVAEIQRIGAEFSAQTLTTVILANLNH